MQIVRLNRDELTEWRKNQPHLVDAEGHLVSEVSQALQRAVDTVTRSARSQRKSLTQRVAIGAGPQQREHTVAVAIRRTGMNDTDFTSEVTVDGHRVVTGKDVLYAKMFQKHGECQLRMPNGVILKVVRDPGLRRPTYAESQQMAPRPEHCPCKAWGHPHPGRHYPTCQWNRVAPPDERAVSDAVPEEEVRILPPEAFSALKKPGIPAVTLPIAAKVSPTAAVVQPPPLDAPESCRNGCLDWATPKGFPIPKGQHHPTCQFAKAWAIKTAKEVPRWLIDLNTGEKVRLATDQEIGEADIVAQRTGSPILHIDERPYAVVLQTELDSAEAAVDSPVDAPAAESA
ncbi:MAG TPA: hypothetical protein VNN80_12080 [Polyangiaceae bacterium]|nr:hypothetical protein [Polyangiaceae bacterium]HWP04464.1 hypothetical protein [Polyangiaceae bacterium]